MTYETEFRLPRLGDGEGGGRIVNWLKAPGESFEKSETVLEVETDKAVVEVPAPEDGAMLEHVAAVDDLVDYQDVLARVELAGEAPAEVSAEDSASASRDESGQQEDVARQPTAGHESTPAVPAGERVFATPYARKLAGERGIELTTVSGTGKHGRIVGRDIPESEARRAANLSIPGTRSGKARSTSFETIDRMIDISSGRVFMRTWEPAERRSPLTALLVHGMFGDSETWTANAAVLARQGMAVAAVDLPAHGRTECPADEFEQVVAAVIDTARLGLGGPVALVGHSFGAAVAARAARAPELDAAALTLIAPVGLGTEIGQSFIDGMLGANTVEALEREMRKLTLRPQSPGRAYVSALRDRLDANRAQLERLSNSAFHRGVQQIDILPDLENVAADVRIVQGREDAIVPWRHALNAPASIALHFVPHVGHMPQWEASALVNDILTRRCSS